MFKEKFDYKDAHCPSCDYTKDGKILKSKNLKYLVSNIFWPNILFINFQCKNYNKLVNINEYIKKLFKENLLLFGNKYILSAIVYISTENHFTAEF